MARPVTVAVVAAFVTMSALLCCTAVMAQESPADRYNHAGALYREGSFDDALALYEEIIDLGTKNPDLFYNAANAAYRTGSIGMSILYLERARKLAPSDDDILANLAYLNSVKQDQEPEPGNAVHAFLARSYTGITANGAALWAGLCFALALIAATGVLFASGWKRITLIVCGGLLGVVFLISTVMLIEKIHHERTVTEAVIMADEASAYSGPDTDNVHIFTIHEGTKVVIERSQDDWNLVRLGSGAGGWIRAGLMESI